MEQFEAHEMGLPPVVARRCRFIIEENRRVLDLAQALPAGDANQLAALMTESYHGARDLYEIGVPAMAAMMTAMQSGPGVIGARQAGAGFGGCMVALVEEIFWRSFAMRLAVDWDGDYWKQSFGKPSRLSFAVVTGLFMAAHRPVDYFGAFIYGTLTYVLCIWSRNLGACVAMHFVANLLMGLYAMGFGKYGLW